MSFSESLMREESLVSQRPASPQLLVSELCQMDHDMHLPHNLPTHGNQADL